MTLPEIALYLDDDFSKKRPPAGARAMSNEEIMAYAVWRKSLTAEEYLEAVLQRKV